MQVCLITAQVKSGAGVRSEWWRTDRSVTPDYLPCPEGASRAAALTPGREGGRSGG